MALFAGNGDGGKTAVAATHIQYLVPPNKSGFTRITTLNYTNPDATHVHNLTFARPLGRTTANGANAAGQAVINLTADPGVAGNLGGLSNPIDANDFLAIREKDGITRLYQVLSISTLAITLTGNLVAGTVGGESVWLFGELADTDGRSGSAHPIYTITNGTLALTDRDGGVCATFAKDEPILFDSSNGTTAGTLNQLSWGYSVY